MRALVYDLDRIGRALDLRCLQMVQQAGAARRLGICRPIRANTSQLRQGASREMAEKNRNDCGDRSRTAAAMGRPPRRPQPSIYRIQIVEQFLEILDLPAR